MEDKNKIEKEPLIDVNLNSKKDYDREQDPRRFYDDEFKTPFPFMKYLYHSCFVLLSLIYLVILVGLPFFNKTLFKFYNFPITASFFQTFGSSIILFIFNIIQYNQQKNDLILRSYFFDKNFVYKNLIMLPVSLCFSAVMILTNLGIQSAPINIHIIFKSTNIIWVIIFSMLINKEKPSIFEFISGGLLMFGAIMVSLDFVKTTPGNTTLPIIFNLLSSFFESVTIVVLKWACTYLYRNDDTISVIEISFFKVTQATFIIMVPMFILEKIGGFKILHDESETALLIISGIIITIIYQTAMVWLSKSLYSFTVGLISQIQIIPQVIISAIIFKAFSTTKLHLAGLVLCVCGCTLFALYHFCKVYPWTNSKFKQFKTFLKTKFKFGGDYTQLSINQDDDNNSPFNN